MAATEITVIAGIHRGPTYVQAVHTEVTEPRRRPEVPVAALIVRLTTVEVPGKRRRERSLEVGVIG